MKIFCVINNYSPVGSEVSPEGKARHIEPDAPVEWYMLPDSTLVRNNNPMFVQDFDTDFVAFPSLVIRIGKLGKNIAEKFASRYYNAVAPGLAIQARGLLEDLKRKGLPWSRAVAFDRSCMLGDFKEIGDGNDSSCVYDDGNGYNDINGSLIDFEGEGCKLRWNCKSLIRNIDAIVSKISRENTLKIGDLIFVGLMTEGIRLKIGDVIRGIMDGEELLTIRLR